MTGQDSDERHIESAVTAWARSVFSAPRRLHELVTGVESRDEVVERVVTHVVRRDVRELRTATSERRSTRPRVDPSSVDPFGHSQATLKADSEYVAQCGACKASGLMLCGPCGGSGHGRCPSCHGSGKERSAKTGRPIRCKSCKATGSAPCRPCAGHGSVHCDACLGSGHQLVWLTFEQDQRWEVSVPASSPIVIAHRALLEPRPLNADELVTMTVVVESSGDGPIDLSSLPEPDRHTVRAQLAQIDPRLERIQFQQYLKLVALRRDVTFEMCGTKATLSLTGTQLAGATTPEVLRPIKRRLYAWVALCGVICLAGLLLRAALIGSSSYFSSANEASGWLVAAAVTCSVPALGALLRSWRGGLRFHALRRSTQLWSLGSAAALMSVVAIGLAARPAPKQVERALAMNDVARAREVMRGLEEQNGAIDEIAELEDRLMLAEASRLTGDDRLQRLDAVAARKGAAAGGAAADARAQRLDEVRRLIATGQPAQALALLDKFFADDHDVPVAEERARAHEAALAACTTVPCRLGETIRARAARSTPERVAAAEVAHLRAVAALDPDQITTKQVLPRLQQLHQLHDTGLAITHIALDDADLQARARTAIDAADAGRAAVPLLGNDLAVAEELLGSSTKGLRGAPSIALDGVTAFLSLDRNGRCTGVYAVGDKATERAIKAVTWPATRLLSQAVGRATPLPAPTGSQSTGRAYAGGVAVVVRWRGGAPIELRIGDATP